MSDSGDSSESYDSDSSGVSIVLDFTKLKPYDFEPEESSSEDECENSLQENTVISQVRIGNTDWCLCGRCKSMDTFSESLCCRDTNEIPDELFQGNFQYHHINVLFVYKVYFLNKILLNVIYNF
jgi:hypothetical protein